MSDKSRKLMKVKHAVAREVEIEPGKWISQEEYDKRRLRVKNLKAKFNRKSRMPEDKQLKKDIFSGRSSGTLPHMKYRGLM